MTYRHRINKMLDKLATLKKDGPNSYDGKRINPVVIDKARDLAEAIDDELLEGALVVPINNGNLQFEWCAKYRELELEIQPNSDCHYYLTEDDDVSPMTEVHIIEGMIRFVREGRRTR